MTSREDRIKGVLLGQAAGDALGAGYETGKPSNGHAEMIGGGYGFEPGQWTDDTEQAICVARARSEPEAVALWLLEWWDSYPQDVGGTTQAVMQHAQRARRWVNGGLAAAARLHGERAAAQPKTAGWDPGMANGSLMRTGPVALPFLGWPSLIVQRAREISDLTHFDPWAGDACVLWSMVIEWAVMDDSFVPSGIEAGVEALPSERQEFWYGAIHDALHSNVPVTRNGSAVAAFKAALWAVAHAESLEEGLQLAVAGGGDTDTVAAIAGSLLGAMYGASAVPAGWREMLHGWPGLDADGLERLALEAAGVAVS